jgi:hypothetical protein
MHNTGNTKPARITQETRNLHNKNKAGSKIEMPQRQLDLPGKACRKSKGRKSPPGLTSASSNHSGGGGGTRTAAVKMNQEENTLQLGQQKILDLGKLSEEKQTEQHKTKIISP